MAIAKTLRSFSDFSVLLASLSRGEAVPEWSMMARYDLLREKRDFPWRDRLYRRWRSILASFRWAPPYVSKYDWSPALKHVPRVGGERVLLIWALNARDVSVQRDACRVLQVALGGFSGLLPVLLTDCADFAFFSRLGWQVEYLPPLSGEGEDYAARKCAYLAWRYRDALVLPLGENAVIRLAEIAGRYSTGGPD